mgnify:CR=1 FL=1
MRVASPYAFGVAAGLALCGWIVVGAGCRLGFDAPQAGEDANGQVRGVDASRSDAAVDAGGAPDAMPDSMIDAMVDAAPAPAAVWKQATPTQVGAGSTLAASLPNQPFVGNTVVVWVWSWAWGSSTFAPASVTDNAGNTYELLVSSGIDGGACSGGAAAGAIYMSRLTSVSGALTITVDPEGDESQQLSMAAAEYGLVRHELPPVATSSVIAAAPSPLLVQTGNIEVDGPSLLVGLASECGGYPEPVTWAPGDGWITRAEEPRTSGIAPGSAIEQIADGGGSFAARWTLTYLSADQPAFAMMAAIR